MSVSTTLVARIVLSVIFVLLIVVGMTIQAFGEDRRGAGGGLAGPRAWYVAAAVVFLSVVAITILSEGAGS